METPGVILQQHPIKSHSSDLCSYLSLPYTDSKAVCKSKGHDCSFPEQAADPEREET